MGNQLFTGGKITIETENNQETYKSGDVISGTVLIDQ